MIVLTSIIKFVFFILILLIGGFCILYFLDKALFKKSLKFLLKPLITKEQERKKDKEKENKFSQVEINISKLKKDLSAIFEDKLFNLQTDNYDRFTNVNNQIIVLSKELNTLTEEVMNLKKKVLNKVEEKERTRNVLIENPNSSFQQTIYYARLVDSLNPLGFFVENLQDKPDGCCFMINVLSMGKATYFCVNDKHIQQEMIATFNPVLTNSSEYEIVPQKIDRIEVLSKGELLLSGNVWRIIKKQTIKFHSI